ARAQHRRAGPRRRDEPAEARHDPGRRDRRDHPPAQPDDRHVPGEVPGRPAARGRRGRARRRRAAVRRGVAHPRVRHDPRERVRLPGQARHQPAHVRRRGRGAVPADAGGAAGVRGELSGRLGPGRRLTVRTGRGWCHLRTAHIVRGTPTSRRTTMPGELERFRMVIGGKPVDAASGRTFESQNPYTGRPWAVVPDGGPEDVDAAVAAARAAFEGEWGQTTGFTRAALLRRLGDLIADDAERLARLEVNDSGKLYREMIGQTGALGAWYHYYAGLADKIEGRQIPSPNPNYLVYTRREPVGVVAAITPWNSPLLLMTWKLAPALAAGCTVVVKPSEHAPVSTLAFAELVERAGFPPGVVNVVTGLSRETGAALAAHPGVDKIAFTGSTATGRAVARAAADNINKVTLELGGKSPQVVFPDADLEAASNGIVAGVFAATGQTCMAGSRLIVHADVHDELVRLVADRASRIELGDPTAPDTEMG